MSENRGEGSLIHVKQGGELSTYDIAKQALALAVTVDEAKAIHDDAERMAFYARQANDRDLIADAMALVMQSRRRLGELLIKAKEAGQLSRGGRPSKDQETGSRSEQVNQSITLKQAGIDRKLSMEAQKLAGYAEDDFEAVIEKGRQKIRAGGAVVINPVKDLDTADKKVMRAVREATLAANQKALPDKKFGVIMEDPEWPFDVWSEAGKDRSAENHYPTSALALIEARPVETIAADDCVLFLWVTAPHHAVGNGAMIMRARGFEPKAEIIWDKVEPGTGFWFRNQHEILLVGVRGKVPAPALGTQWPSIVRSPKGAHSEKPDWAYELIEDYYPNLSKMELNARRRRDGWDAWGFEAPDDESQAKPVVEAVAGDAMSEAAAVAVAPGAAETGSRLDGGRTPSATSEQMDATAGETAIAGEDGGTDPLLACDANSIRPDEPDDAAGEGPNTLTGRPLAAEPETGADQSGAEGGGEGCRDPALPDLSTLSSADKNEIIRAQYAIDPFPGVAAIGQLTGLKPDAVKQRARTMKLGSQDRQKAAVRVLMSKINDERRAAE